VGMSGGSLRWAAAMAACTSWAAASMSRSRLNCRVMEVAPRALVEFMLSSPAMVENCASRGVATEAAMVSGEAPGRLAVTEMVGKSTLGSSDTGRARKAMMPKMTKAAIKSVVITGRRMQSSGSCMAARPFLARWGCPGIARGLQKPPKPAPPLAKGGWGGIGLRYWRRGTRESPRSPLFPRGKRPGDTMPRRPRALAASPVRPGAAAARRA
jgi:hypothetical protein